MNLFQRVVDRLLPARKEQARTLASIFQSWSTGSSPRIDVNNMESYLGKYADQAWVYSCINIIATKAASVPLKVYRKNGDNLDAIADHPLQLLLESVNPFMNGYDLMEGTHGFKELTGNAYWLLDKLVDGKPTEIYPLNPKCVKVKTDAKGFPIGYIYEIVPGQTGQFYDLTEVLHFKSWNPLDYLYGLPPICPARDSSDTMMFSDQYNKAFFQNGAEPGGVLSSEQTLDEDNKKEISKGWAKLHQGSRKAHKVAVLDGGLKWTSTSATHSDMQFPELKRMTREDVLTVFTMPPVMVGVFDEANYSNADVQRRIFWMDCIIPRLKKIEGVINERLVRIWDKTLIVRFDLGSVEELAEDTNKRAQADNWNVQAGILTVNEIRKERHLDEVAWGDTWYAPFGLAPVVLPGEEPVTTTPTDTPPPPPPESGKAVSLKETPPEAIDEMKVRRDALWVRYKDLTDSLEKQWLPVMRSLFNEQEKEVIHNLRESDWKKTVDQNRLNKLFHVKQSVDVILFDRANARRDFRRDGHKLIEKTVKVSADNQIEDNNLGIDFNLSNPEVRSWINTKAFKFSEEVNQTTEEALRRELTEAISLGESLSAVEDRVAKVFDIARGSRTAMIARTEVISASNEGAVASYKQSGVVEGVEWISSRDNRVREEHQIDGETVQLGGVFSNGLEYPGDPKGEPSNVINCRCTVAPVVKKGE